MTPDPFAPYESGVKVVDQRPDGSGAVLVTFAFPGLKRATLRMPWSMYLEGHHTALGQHLARTLPTSSDRARSATGD